MSPAIRNIFIHIVFPLVAGFLIYYFFRPGTWLTSFLPHNPQPLAAHAAPWKKILVFSGPDFFWCYSLASALFLWYRWNGVVIAFFPLYVFLLLMATEWVQMALPRRFSFDWIDLFAAIPAFLLSFFLLFKRPMDRVHNSK